MGFPLQGLIRLWSLPPFQAGCPLEVGADGLADSADATFAVALGAIHWSTPAFSRGSEPYRPPLFRAFFPTGVGIFGLHF